MQKEKSLIQAAPNTVSNDLLRSFQKILNRVISITGADFGNIQLLNAKGTGLEIIVQRGFNANFLNHFSFVSITSSSSVCGRSAKFFKRVMVEDVEIDPLFKEHLDIARSVPFRAVQSTPVLDRKGKFLLMISTHFREPRLPDSQKFEELDHYIEEIRETTEVLCARARNISDVEKLRNINWFLYSMNFFQGLCQSDKKSLMKAGIVREYMKDNEIFSCGDKADHMLIVLNGWVKIYNVNEDDRESGIMLLTQGDEFGAESIFDGGAYIYAARAETKAQILEIPAACLKKMARESPDISEKIMRVLSEEIKQRQITEICLRHKKATQRVACLLLRLTSWMNGNGGTFPMPYKKALAAVQLDMDQATFSRALADMKDLDVSTKESEITIKDHCCIFVF